MVVVAAVGAMQPWAAPQPPSPGDVVTIPLLLSPALNSGDVGVQSAAVNGLDVGHTWAAGGGATLSVTYTTQSGGENWPWVGLAVEVTLVDGTGLTSHSSVSVLPGSPPTEVSAAAGVGDLASAFGSAVCLADVDGDGDVDVYGGLTTGRDLLFINDGGGNFTEEGAAWGFDGERAWIVHGCVTGDVSGDGMVDLLVATSGLNEVHLNNASGGFVDQQGAVGLTVVRSSRSLALGDLDGDGDLDTFECNSAGAPDATHTNAAGVSVSRTEVAASSDGDCQQALLGDVNGDGALDIVVANGGGATECT